MMLNAVVTDVATLFYNVYLVILHSYVVFDVSCSGDFELVLVFLLRG